MDTDASYIASWVDIGEGRRAKMSDQSIFYDLHNFIKRFISTYLRDHLDGKLMHYLSKLLSGWFRNDCIANAGSLKIGQEQFSCLKP